MKMAWRLHEAFGIPAEALIAPYDPRPLRFRRDRLPKKANQAG